MSNPDTTTDEPVDLDTPAGGETDTEPTAAPEAPVAPPKSREERFRNRAQTAESRVAELEAAATVSAAQVEEMNRRAAELYVTDLLANPEELWRDGTDLANLLDDVGVTSEEAARARAAQLAEQHSYLRAPKPQRTPSASVVTGTMPDGGGTSWADAFGPPKT
jgi:hypothetical protein